MPFRRQQAHRFATTPFAFPGVETAVTIAIQPTLGHRREWALDAVSVTPDETPYRAVRFPRAHEFLSHIRGA